MQPGPLVRRQLGWFSEQDRQRRAAASAAGTPSRAQPVSRQMHPRGLPEVGNCTVLPGPEAGRAGPRLRTGCVPACGMPLTLPQRCGQWPDDQASGTVTRPVAAAPRIGRNAGRWLQSQSESGWRAHGPDVDHGRRAEPGRCPGPRSTGHACPSRASLAGLLGTCGPRPH